MHPNQNLRSLTEKNTRKLLPDPGGGYSPKIASWGGTQKTGPARKDQATDKIAEKAKKTGNAGGGRETKNAKGETI